MDDSLKSVPFEELTSGFYKTLVDNSLGVFYLSVSPDKSKIEMEHSHYRFKHVYEINSPEDKWRFGTNGFYKIDAQTVLSCHNLSLNKKSKAFIEKKLLELGDLAKTH